MLKIENLQKAYGDRVVLDRLNLAIGKGEVYGLLGPNGAGKTTTINILCNLISVDGGSVSIDDRALSADTKRIVGVAPQDNLVYQTLTCAENLRFFARLYGIRGRKVQERIGRCLAEVNLTSRANSIAGSLSGGMLRRLNMAIALVHQPQLLILDEPTTGLDIEARYEIWDTIGRLQAEGTTILLTTHLLDEAERLCGRIGILKQGKIVAEGTLAQLRQCIAAAEILVVNTGDERGAIDLAAAQGFTHRRYGNDLAFWLPERMDLKEIMLRFDSIDVDSIARHPVKLEHIYLELTQQRQGGLDRGGLATIDPHDRN
jgi:ABC-2 type transport system ATP-binding protein